MKKQNVNEAANIAITICNVNYDCMDSVRADVKKMCGEIGHTLSENASDAQVKKIAELCIKHNDSVSDLKNACALYNETFDRIIPKDDQTAADKKTADLVRSKQEIIAHEKACGALAHEIATYTVVSRERGTALHYLCANLTFTFWKAKEDSKTGKIAAVTATKKLKASDFAAANLSAMGCDPAWITMLEGLSALLIDKYADRNVSKKVKAFAEKTHISVDGLRAKENLKDISNSMRKDMLNAIVKAMIGKEYSVSTALSKAIAAAGITYKKTGDGATIWNQVDFANFFVGICADLIRVKNGQDAKFAFVYSATKAGKTETVPAPETATETVPAPETATETVPAADSAA